MTSRTKKIIWLVCFGLAGLILLLGVVEIQNRAQEPKTRSAIDEIHRLVAAPETEELAELLYHSLFTVPAGEFIQGSDQDGADESPQRRVYLEAFEIDPFEVTHAQFQRFVLAGLADPPRYWSGTDFPEGTADFPVLGVSWEAADAYCAWAGKRLPTEAEWEKACRGSEGNVYPWGMPWKSNHANLGLEYKLLWPARIDDGWQLLMSARKEQIYPRPQPVGSFPFDASIYNVYDLAGNASEWVADWYNWNGYSNLPDRNPFSAGPAWNHVLRGGAWFDRLGQEDQARDLSRCAKRNSSHSADDPRVGFRCAKSIP